MFFEFTCSNCGQHGKRKVSIDTCEKMYRAGYRAVGHALYCPECVRTWKERNRVPFDAQYNAPKLWRSWWKEWAEGYAQKKKFLQNNP